MHKFYHDKVTSPEIREMFDRFRELKIMIIGDVMIDSYMWGNVERISPEAPIPIVSVSKRENRPGGAANVALNVQSLGATPLLCSVIGNDGRKDSFMDMMLELGMDTSGIMISDERKTTIKTRIISGNQQLLRIDEENNEPVGRTTEQQFNSMVENLFSTREIDAVIFEDYDKGVITPLIIEKTIESARKRGIPVTADPKKRNFCNYTGIDLFTPNLKEMADGLKMDIPRKDVGMIAQAARELQEINNIRYLLVTLSEMGIYLRHGGKGTLVPTDVRDIADVSGAGDTVISVATACLAAGACPGIIAKIANLAGGIVCEKVGVVPIDRILLLEETMHLFGKEIKKADRIP
jgi:D-glycero-beta-D-manno-heptose-7-phosphate kinase